MSTLADKFLKEMTGSMGVSGPASGFKTPRTLEEPKKSRLDKLKDRTSLTGDDLDELTAPTLKALGLAESLLLEGAPEDLTKMANVVVQRCLQLEKFLKKKKLGVTAQAFKQVGESLKKQQEQRSSLDPLMDAERVVLSSMMRTGDITVKLGNMLEDQQFHDYCQELRPEVESLLDQMKDLIAESRRLSSRQLEDDASIDLQLHKYLESTRDWADRFDDRVNDAASRFF